MGIFSNFFKPKKPARSPFTGKAYRGTGGELPKHAPAYQRWAGVSQGEADDVLNGELHFVQSSNVASIQYHPDAQKLMVEFHRKPGYTGRTVYFYRDVPPDLVVGFLRAGSKGTYIHNTFVKTKWPFD